MGTRPDKHVISDNGEQVESVRTATRDEQVICCNIERSPKANFKGGKKAVTSRLPLGRCSCCSSSGL